MRLHWTARTLTLREPLHTARGVTHAREAVEVALEHDGTLGHGEVVTSRYYALDGAAIDATLYVLADVVTGCATPAELRAALPELRERFAARLGVLAALDAAVHDLAGRFAGSPVHALLALPGWAARPTAYTIGVSAPADAAARARRLTAAGFTTLKLKLDAGTGVEVVAAVRAAAPRATLLVDPNGAWSAPQAARQLDALAPYRVAAVEQPVPAGDLAALAWVGARSPIPVVADEDARTEADIARLAGTVQAVNMKLVECGGIGGALAMAGAAERAGLAVMFGCLAASTLSQAPAVHLAPLARWLDLDGHLLLAGDPWRGIGGDDGQLTLPTGAGLGVRRW